MKKIVNPPSRINEGIEDKDLFRNDKKRSFCIKDTTKYGPDYCKRAIRSYSHLSFAMRPEFVPKPKPKNYEISPSPLLLSGRKLNFDFTKNETIFIHSYSDDNRTDDETNDLSYTNKKDEYGRLSETRKEMLKFKNNYQRISTVSSKDTESLTLIYYEITALHKKYHFYDASKKKKSSKSIFSKVIKRFLNEDVIINDTNNSKHDRNTVNTSKNFSILNILEESAERELDVLHCKSTLI